MINILARDVFLNALLVFVALVVILLLLVNPEAKDETTKPPGNLMVTIVWPEGDTDVDLWTYSEGEERPVGFSNRSGRHWSLLRDDLGTRNDTMPMNVENAYSREIPKGRTIINVHCFQCKAVPVPVAIEIRAVVDGWSRVVLQTSVTLHSNRQELTVVSFELTEKGQIVPGSAHNVFTPLYEDWGK